MTYNIRNAQPWVSWSLYTYGQTVTFGGNPGVSTGAPTGSGTDINNGSATVFSWSSAIDYTSLDAFAAANPVLMQPTTVQFWNEQPGTAYPLRSCNVMSSASAPLTTTAPPGESFRDGVDRPLGAPNAIQAENLLTSSRSHGVQQAIVTNNDLATAHHDANAPGMDKPSTAGTVTAVTYNIRDALPWVSGALYTEGQTAAVGGNAYRCIVPGVSTGAPTGTGTDINNGGTAVFNWSSAIDYTSLDAFAAANPVLTQPTIVQLWNDQPGTAYPDQSCNVVSSASAPLTITAAPGESFRDGVDRPLGAPNAAYGVDIVSNVNNYASALTVNTQFVTITGIQAENLLSSNGVRLTGVQQAIIANNDLAASHHDANALEVDKLSTAGTVTVYNNLLLGLGGGGGGVVGGSIGVSIVNASANDTIAEDTIVRPSNYEFGDIAISVPFYTSGFTVRNDAIFGFAAAVRSGNAFQSDGHNASDLSLPLFNFGPNASGGTYQSVLNVPFTNATFLQPSNAGGSLDLRPAPGSVLVGNGSTAVPSSVDIFGDARVSPYSIGAAEPVPCFVHGTRIATARGQVPVEKLQIGERVRAMIGAERSIKWIGRRACSATRPVRIRAGALGNAAPMRNLSVSPEHALAFWDDGSLVLVPAHLLVNGITIVYEPMVATEYFHLELEEHDIVLAEGAWAETFVDDYSRVMFDNASEFSTLYPREVSHPAHFCAPRVEGGAALVRIRAAIETRAGVRHGPLEGHLDRADDRMIEGWAYDPANPACPVLVEILIDDEVAATVMADQYRADLRAMNGGHCAFYFPNPPIGSHALARRANDGRELGFRRTAT